MTVSKGEWYERIGWYLATRGPSPFSGVMSGIGREMGWRSGPRKALKNMVATNRVEHSDETYRLNDRGALDLANSLIQSGRFKSLSVPMTEPLRDLTKEGAGQTLFRSNFRRTDPVFLMLASTGNVLSMAASAVNMLTGSSRVAVSC